MSSQNEAAALGAVAAFLDAFNAQDYGALADSLNYPHIRLANDRFATIQSREAFVSRSGAAKRSLDAERWHHTVMTSAEVVHGGKDKVHLAIRFDRCHEDGSVYNTFDTLWIATQQDAHWGIQFRSSFLR